jgi:hypothetical protein
MSDVRRLNTKPTSMFIHQTSDARLPTKLRPQLLRHSQTALGNNIALNLVGAAVDRI